MKTSEFYKLCAKANRICALATGERNYTKMADSLDADALVAEVEEIFEPRDYEWENRNG